MGSDVILMAANPLKPKDSGKIGMPKITEGMNKFPPEPSGIAGGRGAKNDPIGKKPKRKARRKSSGPTVERQGPPISESVDTNDDAPTEQKEEQPTTYQGAPSEDDAEATEAERKAKILARARKRMDYCIATESENRKWAVEDLKFKAGEQWPSDVAAQRNFDRRPCLTINRIPVFVNLIVNDIRQNRPAINVSPVGDKSDREVAKMYRGLIRFIERACAADIAYDTGMTSAVDTGEGYWRIVTEYEDADSFNQVLVIKRIRNRFTVYLDPTRQDPTGADAQYGFVTEMIPRDDFIAQWPDADPMPYTQGGAGEAYRNWQTLDTIRIAEYFEIDSKKRTLVALSNGHVGWEDELNDAVKGMIAEGTLKVLNRRESDHKKVMWYKLTAVDILEEAEWPGSSIPIVQVVGSEIDVEGKVRYSGLIRNAKDAQRMVNYWSTLMTEIIALQPKAPYIGAEGQFEGHEGEWKQANIAPQPYLEYRPMTLEGQTLPAPARQPVAAVPAGIQQALQNAAQDLQATTGVRFDATLNERMIDESGEAIRQLRRVGDVGAFHYVDNFARSLRRTGEMLVELIPKIYDAKRVVTILREDDTEEQVMLDPNAASPFMRTMLPPQGGNAKQQVMLVYNQKYGQYGVTVTTGPSYATKRAEAAASMMDFVRALPQTANLVVDLIAQEMDWPGAEKIANRLAKAIPPQLLTPDLRDMTPQVQAMLQALDMQVKQLTVERMMLMKQLTEKQTDQTIAMTKVQNDFEAKLIGIVQKAEAAFNTHQGSQLQDLANGVKTLMELLEPKKAETKETENA